jgi:hypothetical protein
LLKTTEALIKGDNLKEFWKLWLLKTSRVALFVWSAALRKILTHDNLRKRNVVMVEWCCRRKKSGKTIDHLLLHCEVARDLWSYILTLFGIEWVMPRTVLELLTNWGASVVYGPTKEAWWLVPLCLM